MRRARVALQRRAWGYDGAIAAHLDFSDEATAPIASHPMGLLVAFVLDQRWSPQVRS
jgi:hypothetical protein